MTMYWKIIYRKKKTKRTFKDKKNVLEKTMGTFPQVLPLRMQRSVDLFEFQAILVYKVSYRTAMAVTERNCLRNTP